ncbi:Hypothetical protein R9X50_00631100 [Acrodontium crateriforme]|uniref:Xaa-Pro aminopeptidase n=1 Tax=Acrodontium crateriforme TaxID=150365 RepID=A0AAQ3MBC2_9PEZI|nr:Hypothetical protein R9X50_00631100 [Acrodontium crateriforme]
MESDPVWHLSKPSLPSEGLPTACDPCRAHKTVSQSYIKTCDACIKLETECICRTTNQDRVDRISGSLERMLREDDARKNGISSSGLSVDYSILRQKYPAKSHARRVAEKLGRSNGIIMLEATPSGTWPDSDQTRAFRQSRYFYYLTGCNEPDCTVTYDIASDKLTLWLPVIDQSKVVWSGRGSTVAEAMDKYDVDEALYFNRLSLTALTEAQTVYKYISSPVDYVFPQSTVDLVHAMDSCRVIKDNYEIALISKANDITADAHINVLVNLHRFTSEPEMEAAFMQTCIENRAREQAYWPIVGSGKNGSVLHYIANSDDFGNSQTVVMDAGCEFRLYACDVTRTMPLNEKNPGYWPSKEAENIYKLVEKMQETCIAKLQHGAIFKDIHNLSVDIALDGLMELGILQGNRDEIAQAETARAFYMHGLGHHVGLEVHDVSPPISSAQKKTTNVQASPLSKIGLAASWDLPRLEPNMVMTIEPGIYFNSFLLEKFYLNDEKHKSFFNKKVLSRYMDVGGVRIEDDILITRDGNVNLTTAPKGEEMLDIIRSSVALSSITNK